MIIRIHDLEVHVGGKVVHVFEHAVAMKAGWTGTLADGSTLEVRLCRRYGSLFARVDVRRDGRAVPGSAWDPVRLVKGGALLAMILGVWPAIDVVLRRPVGPLDIGLGVALVVLGGLARRAERTTSTIALGAAAALLVARAVLLIVAGGTFAPAVVAVLASVLVRDARAARDLPAVRPSARRS